MTNLTADRPAEARMTLGRCLRMSYAGYFDSSARIGVGVLCVSLAAVALLALPVLAGAALDEAAEGGSRDRLGWLCAGFAGCAVLEALFRYAGRRLLIGASRRTEERLRQRLERHLARLPVAWFDGASTGDLISRFTQDVELLRFVTGPALLYGGQSLIVIPGGVILLGLSSPWIAATAAVAFVALGLALWRFAPLVRRDTSAAQETIGAIGQRSSQTFAGIRVLKLFGRATHVDALMAELGDEYAARNVAVARSLARVNAAIHLSLDLVVLGALAIGAGEVVSGRMTLGELLEFWALLGVVLAPLLALGFLSTAAPRAMAAAQRLAEILDEPTEPSAARGSTADTPPSISVRGLTFRYAGTDRDTLQNVSFDLAAGQTLGLVGAVGCGKSTLLAVLLRFYDPPRGTVFIDDVDVLEIEPAALRRRFAVAGQDPFLFSGTIRDNVVFGLETHDVALERAVTAAALDQDLSAFEAGLETTIGERGVTLSGGQRQRVALARAFYSERPALLLDDAASAVDHVTESRIRTALERELRGRTAIVAAHRLSWVASADRILVLERGAVAEFGSHEDLSVGSGHYARCWQLQAEARALGGDAS